MNARNARIIRTGIHVGRYQALADTFKMREEQSGAEALRKAGMAELSPFREVALYERAWYRGYISELNRIERKLREVQSSW